MLLAGNKCCDTEYIKFTKTISRVIMNKYRQAAFTMIELLVVLVILGLLAGLVRATVFW